jgi:hypothetical protein
MKVALLKLRVLPWDCAGCWTGAVRALERQRAHCLHMVGMGRMVWGSLASFDKPGSSPRNERDSRKASNVMTQRIANGASG